MGPKKMFALLLAVVVPSPQLIFLPLLLPSMTLHQPTLLFADASPYRERRRRRREEEERESMKYWKEKYGYEYVQNEEDGGGGANNNNNNNNEEGDTNRFGSASIGGLFVTQKPRDALEGIRSAFSNALRGSFFGLAALVASPIGGLKFGAGGALGGLVIGVILGVTMPIVGFVVGGYQILRGLVATPEAIVDGFIHCMVFDETKRAWMEYRLDEDMEEIKVAMKEEQTSEKKNGGGGNGRRESASSSSSRRKVKSTEYYDLLGIQTDASSSDIRSAYRKRARTVHPDKNPDDPDAEQKFRELSAAYQTLSDPAKRKKYDSSGIGVNPEQPDGGAGGPAMVDPIVFFAVLFGSEQVEPYIGELGMATAFDALLKLGSAGSPASFESWEDIKTAFGWSEAALKRRKRETEIAIHLRSRVSDYVEGFLALDAFKDSCWEEAVSIAKGGSYGASFLLAIGPALVAEANAFLGYRSSVLGSWRGPVSNAKRNLLFLRRKFAVTKSVLRTIRESLKALYESAEFLPKNDDDEATRRSRQRLEKDGTSRRKPERVVFNDKELLKDNLSNTIPTVLDMAWAINYVDISNTLYGACSKLFYDADVSAWEERLRRAEAVHILGSQFYLVGLEVTGGNTTLAGGDVDDIKARANAAFMESLKKSKEDNDEM